MIPQNAEIDEDKLPPLTIAEVAQHFKVSPRTIWNWINTEGSKLVVTRYSARTVRIKWAAVREFEQTGGIASITPRSTDGGTSGTSSGARADAAAKHLRASK